MTTQKMWCIELPSVRGYSPDTMWELAKTQGTEEECELLLGWLERIYG